MANTSEQPPVPSAPERHLSLFDSTNIIVGIIIGSSIYEAVPLIAANVPRDWSLLGFHISGYWALLGIWAIGAVLSLFGALCYTELATTYPKAGGDYVYLTKAFGRRMGFIFAWSQLWIVRPGSIGAMAYVFARYANEIWRLQEYLPELNIANVGTISAQQLALLVYAVGSVLVLTAINILGVKQGKLTQNVLTVAKFLGLAALCVVGLLYASPEKTPDVAADPSKSSYDFGLALILVLFAYGGWAEMGYVGAEVRDPRKNILRALILGTMVVGVCYVVANAAFVHALGFDGLRNCLGESAPAAAKVLKVALGDPGGKIISVLICVSALGAVNGLIFTGARIYYAMGTDHRLFAALGKWDQRSGTPVRSLVIQCLITLLPVVVFGLQEGAFEKMVIFTTPLYWVFMVLVALALYQLRETEPNTLRPYRVRGYPFTPFIFAVSSLYVLYSGLLYAYSKAHIIGWWTFGFLAVGFLASLYDPDPEVRLKAPPDRAAGTP